MTAAPSPEQLLEELQIAAANMLARVRLGGGAREQLREAVERVNRYFEARRLGVILVGGRHIDRALEPIGIEPSGPGFAPPDARPAHERVIEPSPEPDDDAPRPTGRAAAYKD
jgi:hypothetical protein